MTDRAPPPVLAATDAAAQLECELEYAWVPTQAALSRLCAGEAEGDEAEGDEAEGDEAEAESPAGMPGAINTTDTADAADAAAAADAADATVAITIARGAAPADAPAVAAPPRPPPERLAALLATRPSVFWFGPEQTCAERAALMARVPAAAQRAAKRAMLEEVLARLEYAAEDDEKAPQPLLYYMATDDEPVADGAEEARQASYDWRLAHYSLDAMQLCDFNGWPGDNQSGAGVYWDSGRPDATTLIFRNNDGLLSADRAEYDAAIAAFGETRMPDGEPEPDTSTGG